MGIAQIDQELCNGCGACVDDCPMDCIRMDEQTGKAYIAYGKDCGICFQCSDACPVDAIKVSSLAPRELSLPY